MGSGSRRLEASLLQRSADHLGNSPGAERPSITQGAEQAPRDHLSRSAPQITADRLTHLFGQRQLPLPPSLARPQPQNPGAPIDLFQCQMSDFSRSEAQACQAKEDGIIAKAGQSFSLYRSEQ